MMAAAFRKVPFRPSRFAPLRCSTIVPLTCVAILWKVASPAVSVLSETFYGMKIKNRDFRGYQICAAMRLHSVGAYNDIKRHAEDPEMALPAPYFFRFTGTKLQKILSSFCWSRKVYGLIVMLYDCPIGIVRSRGTNLKPGRKFHEQNDNTVQQASDCNAILTIPNKLVRTVDRITDISRLCARSAGLWKQSKIV